MKLFSVLFIIYTVAGGCMGGVLDKAFVTSCNKHLTNGDVVLVYLFWPQVILTSIITNPIGESLCDDTNK